MYLTTEEFSKAIIRPGRHFKCRLRTNDVVLDGITQFRTTGGSNDGDALTLGSTMAQTVTITMDEPTVSLSRVEFKLEIGLLLGDKVEYVPIGLFMPEKIQNKAGKITFTAYDRMMRLSPRYVSTLPESTDTLSVLSEITKNTGVPIVKDGLNAIPIKMPEDITYRDALSNIAQLYGRFANVNRDGVIELRFWEDAGYVLEADQGISGFEKSEVFTVAMMQVNTEDGVLSAGSGGKGITFDNPFMTQSVLNNIFERVNGFSYNPVTCPVILGDPRLDPWDMITIVDAAGTNYKVPIMALMYEYDGGLSMQIASTIADASETDFDYKSPYQAFKEDTVKRIKEAKEKAVEAVKEADNALQGSTNAIEAARDAMSSAATAQESANAAQEAANNAQSAVDVVEKEVESLESTVNLADAVAKQAKEAAATAEIKAVEAKEAALNAQKEATDAKEATTTATEKADTALEKAEAAKEDAVNAKTEAEAAQKTAAAAKLDAEQAQKDIDALDENFTTLKNTMSVEYARKTDLTDTEAKLQTQITQNASEISSTASKMQTIDETANNAAQQAQDAQATAKVAQAQADQAVADAEAAQLAADAAEVSAANAQSEADNAKLVATTAQGVADKAQADLDVAKKDLATVTNRIGATEADILAAQTAVDKAQVAADKAKEEADTAVKKAADAQTAADTASTNAANAQTTANTAANKASVAQAIAEAAREGADEAKVAADEAREIASTAQATADIAKTNAVNAQAIANTAVADAANAQKAADDAGAKVAQAQVDLDTAKKNLENVTSRVDATKAEVEAAQADVIKAQDAADRAKAEAEVAQATADKAKADAVTAQTAADNAKKAADDAQVSADEAKAAADTAQKDVNALAVRVTSAETKITQNSEKIALMATKTEVEETLGGYYKKEETKSLIEQSADGVRIAVSSEIQERINNIQVGGRNYISHLAKNWSEGTWSVPEIGGKTTIVSSANGISLIKKIEVEPDTAYRIKLYTDKDVNILFRVCDKEDNFLRSVVFIKDSKWVSDANDKYIHITVYDDAILSDISDGAIKLKLEKGNTATDWTPAPEDIDVRITNAETSISNNSNEINLRATTEDVTEISNKTNEMDKALEDAKALIQENRDAIATLTSRDFKVEFTTITNQINALNGDLSSYKEEVGNWMRFDADGNLVLGATRVTGQDAYELKLTKNRISFMLNDIEVAYISSNQLYITNSTVVQNLKIGGFTWEVRGNGNLGLVWR